MSDASLSGTLPIKSPPGAISGLARPEDFEPSGEVRYSSAELHYDFVPGLERHEEDLHGAFFWYWMLEASDDVGTVYDNANGGVMAPSEGGPATDGVRDIGGQIPDEATWLTLRFRPASGWDPPEGFRRELVIDLVEGRVID